MVERLAKVEITGVIRAVCVKDHGDIQNNVSPRKCITHFINKIRKKRHYIEKIIYV